MPIHNNQLLQRLNQGDERALEAIYDRYHGRLLQVSIQILRSRELAEEVVMDTFLGFWERRRNLPEITQLSWYLYATVKNRSLNLLRKLKSQPNVYLDDVDVDIVWSLSPEDHVISAEYIEQINRAINNLPPRCKQIFVMVKEEHLKYRQVAELLEISLKTVENQMGIALKKLHEAIER